MTPATPSAIASASASTRTVVANGPPVAPVREERDTYFGTEIVDPYRWMESDSPELTAWMRGQADFARKALDGLPTNAELRARVKELDNAAPSVDLARRVGATVFYLKANVGNDTRKLYVRERLDGPERLLVDPDTLADQGKHATIDYYAPSRDGAHVAIGVSQSGSESSVIRVVETKTGKLRDESIDRARYAHPSWVDGKSFFYRRGPVLPPNTPPAERLNRGRVYLHTLGTDPNKDVAVFGHGVSASVPMSDEAFPAVVTNGGPFVLGIVEHGVQPEQTIFVARRTEVKGDKTPWKQLAVPADKIVDFAFRGDDLYVLSLKDAPRGKVLRVRLAQGDLAKATVAIAESEVVLDGIGAAEDGVYARVVDAGIGRILQLGYEANAKASPVALPGGDAAVAFSTSLTQSGALVLASSWTKASTTYLYDAKTKAVTDTGLSPKAAVPFTDIVSREVLATSADGTKVPLSLIHRKDLPFDGKNPTWLRGYGSYGHTWDPGFEPMNLAWLERGGVIAVCHPRGGGEKGDAWHRAGQLATKPNTVADFLGCAHHLIAEKITSPAHLGGEGTSAGGIMIGGAITAEPGLFGAAIIRVGMTNALRFEQIPIGPFNISEFGTVKTAEGFKMLLAIDAFHRVKDGTPYPAVLVTTGITDPRVSPWQSAKIAARLQARSASGRPVLLRVDFATGHGVGSSRSQVEAERGDVLSFLWTQLGAGVATRSQEAPAAPTKEGRSERR